VEIDGEGAKVIGTGLVLIFSAAAGALGIRRRYFRDNAERDKEASETTGQHRVVVWWQDEARLQAERADKAIKELNAAMLELGSLRAEVASLRARVIKLENGTR